jgi:dCTP deaminase
MFLSDISIRRLVHQAELISPFDQSMLQPASYDVLLGPKILIPKPVFPEMYGDMDPYYPEVDLKQKFDYKDLFREKNLEEVENHSYVLEPQDFILGATVEFFKIPSNVRASIEGKSSLARLGIAPHVAAGYIDPGFNGRITLEIFNTGKFDVVLHAGMKIAQVAFAWVDENVARPYGHPELGSHYQDQQGVEGSKYGQSVKGEE